MHGAMQWVYSFHSINSICLLYISLYQVWDNPAMKARNNSFSSYDYSSFDRTLRVSDDQNSQRGLAASEVIIIASHHKTGTILSQKIFARICAIMKWCCVFHVTKDSLVAVQHSMQNEPVKLMGHTQWAWNPNELGVPYRFVHFYRDPYKKVASGYRYHRDGVEAWCKKPLLYKNACKLPKDAASGKKGVTTKREIFEFCQSVHLCEPCCRLEHEMRYANPSLKSASASKTHTGGVQYAVRPAEEYEFVCQHLSGINVSLMNSLEKSIDLSEAIRIEASIDFYENLRMARIINSTWDDPRSLNIDLDDFMGNYEGYVRMILHHLHLQLTPRELEEIVDELNFYDIDNSPIYRLSQSNPLMNHINQEAAEEKATIRTILSQDAALKTFYSPIFELLSTALSDSTSSVGIKNAHRRVLENEVAYPMLHLRRQKETTVNST
jgi:hypothetical protein